MKITGMSLFHPDFKIHNVAFLIYLLFYLYLPFSPPLPSLFEDGGGGEAESGGGRRRGRTRS